MNVSSNETDNAIALKSDSLYIATSTLPSGTQRKYHWTLALVDGSGAITTYQWAENSPQAGGPEGVVVMHLDHAPHENRYSIFLGYYKVCGFVETDVVRRKIEEIGPHIFQTQANAEENRKAGISCRTWISRLMVNLIAEKCIIRDGMKVVDAQSIEAEITQKSMRREEVIWKVGYAAYETEVGEI